MGAEKNKNSEEVLPVYILGLNSLKVTEVQYLNVYT
jgi:hypothetical protein